MGGGNAEPSAKNSEKHNWKTLPGLVPGLMKQEVHEGTKEIHDSSSLRGLLC